MEILALARRAHQAGDLQRAEQLYLEVLQVVPSNAEAAYLLGAASQSLGKVEQALAYLRTAARLRPNHAATHNHLGVVLAEQGRMDEAITCFVRAVKLNPTWAEAHTNLGHALRDKGGLDKGVISFRETAGRKRDFAHLFSQLGNQLLSKKQFGEAAVSYQQAVCWKPDLAEAHNNLGVAYAEQGKLEEATASFQQAITSKPEYPDAHNNLAVVRRRRGQLAAAETSVREALRLKPDYPEALNNLGLTLRELERLDEAVASFREALRFRPDYADAFNNLGLALKDQGQLAEAAASLQRAVELKPDFVEAHNNLGAALTEQGEGEEAIPRFQQALQLKPDYAQAYYNLAELAAENQYQFSAREINSIKTLLSANQLPAKDASLLHYTLAILLNKTKQYDQAFEHFRDANRLQKLDLRQSGLIFDQEQYRRFIDRVIATCSAGYFERVRSFGIPSELPVFIVGVPRSGTSLVEQILACHPKVFGAGERTDIKHLAAAVRRQLQCSEDYPESLERLNEETVRSLAVPYLARLQELAGPAARLTDKLPGNFNYLGLIATIFPQARVIHCRRGPLDTCVSCFCQNFKNISYAQSLEDLGFHYRQYERLMAHWRRVLPIPMLDVDYEALVADQEKVSRQMIAFLGLEWDDRCLHFHEHRRAVYTASKLQVRRPIYASAVGRWKRFERHLGPLIQALHADSGADSIRTGRSDS
jgi:tetratricopeptide (TPR) repeat protein